MEESCDKNGSTSCPTTGFPVAFERTMSPEETNAKTERSR